MPTVLQIAYMFEPPAAAGGLKINEPGRSSTDLSVTTVQRPLSTGLSIHNLQLTLGLPLPFLGLTHIGFSNESAHFNSALRNPHSAIEKVLNGKYARYLER
ncbi:MAG: hypothetical protein KIT61_01550 [Pyrinomonadaceae bacterium]|nr:hypothetical protein [Pyrinomonadaceae bacterium]